MLLGSVFFGNKTFRFQISTCVKNIKNENNNNSVLDYCEFELTERTIPKAWIDKFEYKDLARSNLRKFDKTNF